MGVLLCAAPAPAAYPGANGKIAFASFGVVRGIAVVNPDGSGFARLTTANDHTPAWSPDGSRIAFVRGAAGGDGLSTSEIYVMNADGSGARAVTNDPPANTDPSWSPDGSQLAYASAGKVYVVPAAGGAKRAVADGADPAWAPDGSRIAYASSALLPGDYPRGPRSSIWTVAPNGSGRTRVVLGAFDTAPSWSPDATRLALFGDSPELQAKWMNADGSNVHVLGQGLPFSPFVTAHPAWSPDGGSIVYEAAFDPGDGQTRLALAIENAASGAARELGTGPSEDPRSPDWQPVTVAANSPPDCSTVRPTPATLSWHGRHGYVMVRLDGHSDPDGDRTTLAVDAIGQDEPLTGPGDRTSPDARRTSRPRHVQLREERAPGGNGRVYRIDFTVTDSGGASCEGRVKVSVPRHANRPAVASPPYVNSLGMPPAPKP